MNRAPEFIEKQRNDTYLSNLGTLPRILPKLTATAQRLITTLDKTRLAADITAFTIPQAARRHIVARRCTVFIHDSMLH